MWVLQALGLEFTMDVGYYGGRGVYEPLMAAFEETYNGNRSPLPIFLHTTWWAHSACMRGAAGSGWQLAVSIPVSSHSAFDLCPCRVEKNPDRVNELERFAGKWLQNWRGLFVDLWPACFASIEGAWLLIATGATCRPFRGLTSLLLYSPHPFPTDFTRTKKDVFWVTVSQLLDWMRNPVPASQLRLSKDMCQPPAAAAAPELPQDGANVTLTFAGGPASWHAVLTA